MNVGAITERLGLRGEPEKVETALVELGSGALRRGDLKVLGPLLVFRLRWLAGENDGDDKATADGREKARGVGVLGVLPKFFTVRKAGRSGDV